MRLFKNRGDIYIPSTKFKSDLEQKILFAFLAFIVAFTIVFVLIVGIKYDFSVKNFFKPKNMNTSEYVETKNLPTVKGKNNFLFIMKNEDTKDVYMCSLIQVDLDNLSYKVCSLKGETEIEGNTITDIYKKGNAGNVLNALNILFDIELDYFIDQSIKQYADIFDYFGDINYTVLDDISYKDNSYYGFNIKIKNGNQKIDGDEAVKLIRYYMAEEKYDAVNEIFYTALTQQINPENYKIKEKQFSRLIDNSITNITIRDFNEGTDALTVLSDETTGVNVYGVKPVYQENSVISTSIDDIRGYFAK